ncbi:MAG: FAD-binding protein [Magnetococcales bacterium]|nr:FAD-binding protein [Magnetococcales bacterium]NGZ27785.1 FAD-binding protein [Magnetococcales bacterium]
MALDILEKFPPLLKESIRMVERTRSERIDAYRRGDVFPYLSLSDRQAWLKEYHPDYRSDGKRALQVGPSKGLVCANELADLLESWPRPVVREKIGSQMPVTITADVLIIGGGGAGSVAAIAAAEAGAKVILATKLRHGDSNTIMAEGGIQVADQECDSPQAHFLDVMGGGHFTNDADLVEALVTDGPAILGWLEESGMLLDKYPTGRLKVRHGGGTSRKRLHSSGDVTGLEMMRVIRDRAESLANITVLPFSPAVELLTDDNGRAVGALLEHALTGALQLVRAGAVVLATGGLGRIHLQGFPTSNHYGATADGLVMAYRAGLPVRDLQYNQYHPTGIAFPESNLGLLVTEKFRGLGAQIINRYGDEFVNSLEPRDVTTSAILRECFEFNNGVPTPGGGTGVWLDVPMIDLIHGRNTIEKEFPGRFREFMHKGMDIRKVPILTFPTLHYQNGGVVISADGGTDMPGLFAAGEVTGGVHGNNRLMGNALLEIMVFGLRAGRSAANFVSERGLGGEPGLSHVEAFMEQLETAQVPDTRQAPRVLPNSVRPVVLQQSRSGMEV